MIVREEGMHGITYVRYGDIASRAAIFFHGHAGSARYLPEEDMGIPVLSFNRPGVAGSEIWGYYTMEEYLERVRKVLDDLGVTEIHVTGHSVGGVYAQVFAEMYPDKVKTLTLLSSLPNLNSPLTDPLISKSLKRRRFLMFHGTLATRIYFRRMAITVETKIDEIIDERIRIAPKVDRSFMETHRDLYRSAVLRAVTFKGRGAFYDAYAMYQKRPNIQIDPKIKVFVWGGLEDPVTPPHLAEYLSNTYNGRLHLIPEAGHMMFMAIYKDALKEALES